MKTVKRIILTAAALVALSGLAFSAESAPTDSSTDTGISTTDAGTQGGGTSGSTCTDCFDP